MVGVVLGEEKLLVGQKAFARYALPPGGGINGVRQEGRDVPGGDILQRRRFGEYGEPRIDDGVVEESSGWRGVLTERK